FRRTAASRILPAPRWRPHDSSTSIAFAGESKNWRAGHRDYAGLDQQATPRGTGASLFRAETGNPWFVRRRFALLTLIGWQARGPGIRAGSGEPAPFLASGF